MHKHFLNALRRWRDDEDGQTLVEYGFLISLLALVALAAVSLFGKKVGAMWGTNGERYPDPPT